MCFVFISYFSHQVYVFHVTSILYSVNQDEDKGLKHERLSQSFKCEPNS